MRRTLVFDLDGTLVDTLADLTSAMNRLLLGRHLRLTERAEMRKLVGDGVRALVARALLARDAPFDEGFLAEFVSDYTAHAAVATRPFPGVVDTLKVMAECGWQFAVCTNKPEEAARAVLRALDLDHWFVAIGGGDSFTTRKPDPAHLLSTLSAAKGEAIHAVMVGDHANDVLAAKGAGVACIFAAWGYGSAEMALGAAATAHDVSDLPALCQQLLPRAGYFDANNAGAGI